MVMLRLQIRLRFISGKVVCGLHGQIIRGRLGRAFAGDETTPGFVTLVDNLRRILLVFSLTGKRKGVFRFSVGDFVDPAGG